MWRTSQLPPRIPFQRKVGVHPSHDPSTFSPPKACEPRSRHHRSLSRNSTLEDQPAWLDELLSDSDSIPKGIFHCRSASDSVTLFHGIVPNMVLSDSRDEEHPGFEECGNGNALESAYFYGPNSPRRKSNVELSESSVLLALSNYVDPNPITSFGEVSQKSGTVFLDQRVSSNELSSDPKARNRHPGQRSRARKLQYIGELERTVNVFKALESELTITISTLLQQKVVLAMENSKLKQQMSRLQQQKLIMDVEYQALKKEANRLKLSLASSLSGRICTYAGSSDANAAELSWEMLDWERLHL